MREIQQSWPTAWGPLNADSIGVIAPYTEQVPPTLHAIIPHIELVQPTLHAIIPYIAITYITYTLH